ncbi:hypothetical protein Acr_01g0011210 [Actinidia rufa]|uniref:DUF4005 domain-containing protein n=1 Tax=Actinidia rufa TaxID=165716 RepID=A0A7J0E4V5_9ERIC|nr:hypothetical protein Acr_01g0011210 [Actinidia rufa]
MLEKWGRKGVGFLQSREFSYQSHKEKPVNGSEKKSSKEKKRGILRHGEPKAFIPIFREPSSIEKILGEADQQKLLIRPPTPTEQPKIPPLVLPRVSSPRINSPRATSARVTSPRATSPRAASAQVTSPRVVSPRVASARVTSPRATSARVTSPRAASPRVASPKATSSRVGRYRPEPTLRYQHLSAIKIQAAYRGYTARKSFRALRGLVRLQEVVRGQNVKRQTMNAMKMMQLLVRVQTQIQLRRIQMLENQALQRQAYKNDNEYESSLGKWTVSQSEAGQNDNWDDSLLTKEQQEARMQRKMEAIFKRERAMAYVYSHQLWKGNPKSARGGFPWWWNWLDRQLPATNPPETQTVKGYHPTPTRSGLNQKPSPSPSPSPSPFGFDNLEVTPRSTRSVVPVRTKPLHAPSNKTPPSILGTMKYSNTRASDYSMRDDDSLTSCPPFSRPNYMTPTVSAKAKVRPSSNPRERFPGTPSGDSKRRFSFPLTPNIGSFKWNKGSSKDSTSQRVLEKHQSLQSIGDLSIDSTISMPAAVGRKPFNRFV